LEPEIGIDDGERIRVENGSELGLRRLVFHNEPTATMWATIV
jgi:hypothetical protein